MKKHSYSHRSGFTLIELLVVISIIALLIGILLPSLGTARTTARAVQSLSQMRQMGLGIHLYANDYKEWTPVTNRGVTAVGQTGAAPGPLRPGLIPRSSQGDEWWHQLGGKLVDWGDRQWAAAPWRDNHGYLTTTKVFYNPAIKGGPAVADWWSSDPLFYRETETAVATYSWEFWSPQQYLDTHPVNVNSLGTATINERGSNAIVTDLWWSGGLTGSGTWGTRTWYRESPYGERYNVLWLGGHAGSVNLTDMNYEAPNGADLWRRLKFLQDNGG